MRPDTRGLKIAGERAPAAIWYTTAMRFAHGDGERMQLVEVPRVFRQRIGCKCLTGENNEGPVCIGANGRDDEPMSRRNPAEVLVHHRHRMAERVKQDCVCRLRTDSGKGQ